MGFYITAWTALTMTFVLVSCVTEEKPVVCSVVKELQSLHGKDGKDGRDGRDGMPGHKGDSGTPGEMGYPGLKGTPGIPGKAGPQGQKGDQGDKGVDGKPGLKGEKGLMGHPGVKGDVGPPGAIGYPGAQGPAGKPGVNGIPGAKGSKGDPGTPESRDSELMSQLQNINNYITKLERVLLLQEQMQVANTTIIATNGKYADFETSKTTCKNLGGSIATPKTKNENNAILKIVKKYNSYAYIGIQGGSSPGSFRYLDGHSLLYTNWYENQPDGAGTDKCVEMYTDGTWNDLSCTYARLTVCEF